MLGRAVAVAAVGWRGPRKLFYVEKLLLLVAAVEATDLFLV